MSHTWRELGSSKTAGLCNFLDHENLAVLKYSFVRRLYVASLFLFVRLVIVVKHLLEQYVTWSGDIVSHGLCGIFSLKTRDVS